MNKNHFSNDATINYYNRNAPSYFKQTVNLDMSSIYPDFLALIPEGGHILDAGCGSGRDTKHFLTLGYQVTAIDASEEMVKLSSKFAGQPTLQLNFRDIEFRDTFDGVWACASLVHISQIEIEDIFFKLIHALKPNGILYISLKPGIEESLIEGRFFSFYEKKSIQNLCKKVNLAEIVRDWITVDNKKVENDQEWLNIIIKK